MARILVVEDDEDIRDSIVDLLQTEGFEVTACADGQAGLDFLRSVEIVPVLILLDLMMPKLNGQEFLTQKSTLRPELASVPIVVLSADNAGAKNQDKMPIAAFLRKPIDVENLLLAVRTHATR